MDATGEGEDRGRADAAAMSAGQQAAFGDGVVGGPAGAETGAPGERRDDGGEGDASRYDGRDEDHAGLVGGGPTDTADAAGDSRASAGEVAADRARAEGAPAAQEEEGLAPGESD